MKSAAVSVSPTVATLVARGEGGNSYVLVQVPTAATVYFGDATVTATDGIAVVATTQAFWLGPNESLYALALTSAVTVAVATSHLGFA